MTEQPTATADVIYTDGFPPGWSMRHRLDATLLVTPSSTYGGAVCLCCAPKLQQGKRWLTTARQIAAAVTAAYLHDSRMSDLESCDDCGIGPRVDEDGRPLPNTHASKDWTCDYCGHINKRVEP